MINLVDNAMLALQSALFGREVYAIDHPAVQTQFESALAALKDALRTQDRISLIAFGDRVVFRNEPLPSGSQLATGIFRRLRARGIECLTFERGLNKNDLAALLEQLPERVDENKAPKPTAHIRFGSIDSASGSADIASAGQVMQAEDLRRSAKSVGKAWRSLANGENIDAESEALGGVVADICTTVAASGGVVMPLANLKSYDEYTFVHTINVAILSAGLAEAIGLRPDQVHDVTLAALMHDIGKQRVPKRLLQKSGSLTKGEFDVMQRHPLEGARLLLGAPGLPEIAAVVAYEHHLHLDGTGYPNVIPDWKTSLASQVVQIADVFDALRTHRPYRDALSLEKSMQIMNDDAGVKFDPTLLNLFFERVAQNTDREFPDPYNTPDPLIAR